MIYLDTETCGLMGPIVIIQYAHDDGPVTIYEVWKEPVRRTLQLMEQHCDNTICGFNLTFDWYQYNKLFNLLRDQKNISRSPSIEDMVSSYKVPPRRYCLKPREAIDLFLVARKTHWQSLMERDNIKIKKVPLLLAQQLAETLKNRVDIEPIYFTRSKDIYHWKTELCPDDPGFMDVVLRFKASSALKALATQIFKISFDEYPLPKEWYPIERQSDPYYLDPYFGWQHVIQRHIDYWHNSKQGRSYAEIDVILLQRLYHHFGEPTAGDDDSVLACCVGAVRHRGYEINTTAMEKMREEKERILHSVPINYNSHVQVRNYILEAATPLQQVVMSNTEKGTLEKVVEIFKGEKIAVRADTILDVRRAAKDIDLLDKLLSTGRFHPDFKIIGTRSGRMAGGSGRKGSINPQGIRKTIDFRSMFPLATPPDILSGGDFKSFEVVIADAVYRDKNLRKDLQSGKSFHAIFGESLFDLSYEDIMASKGSESDDYFRSKTGTFGVFYGQQPKGLAKRLGVSEEKSQSAYEELVSRYPGIGKAREAISNSFCSMRQPGGIGSQVIWKDPAEYIESLLGFRRYYTLENKIVRVLFELAQNPPKYLEATGKVIRRTKEQTPRGAMQSALYACAFQIQARNMRSAANHEIQATGAEITKHLQRRIWDHQPVGVRDWVVQPMNVHDEVMVVHQEGKEESIKETAMSIVEMFKEVVPLIELDWSSNIKNWSEK